MQMLAQRARERLRRGVPVVEMAASGKGWGTSVRLSSAPAALLTEVVPAVVQRFGVRLQQLHNDSTSTSLCGQYCQAKGRSMRQRRPPAITYGFSNNVAAEVMWRPPRPRRPRRCGPVAWPCT
jgi:hypothetical protein